MQLPAAFTFSTRDVEETRSVGGQVFHRHRVTVLGDPAAYAMSVTATTVGPVGLAWLRHGTEVLLASDHEDHYQVNVAVGGSMVATRGAEEVVAGPGTATVHVPDRPASFRGFAGAEPMLGVKIPRRVVQHELGRLLDRPVSRPPQLALGLDVTTGRGAQWLGLVRSLADGLADPEALVHQLAMAAPLARSLVVGLLLAARHEHDDALRAPAPPVGPVTVRAARAHIEAHAAEPITVADVARAAGVGVRGLQLGFARALGTTPTQYLRDVRLQRAHADLRRAAPGTTVAEVAARWGFAHQGRFAVAHRQRYGTSPAEVLRGGG